MLKFWWSVSGRLQNLEAFYSYPSNFKFSEVICKKAYSEYETQLLVYHLENEKTQKVQS